MNKGNALIIIAKYPEKGRVKTRLRGFMTDERRLNLYVTLLERTIEKLGAIRGIDTFIAYAPSHGREYFSRFTSRLISLPDGDLGFRMYSAFKEVFHHGYDRAALVGADIPDLSSSIVQTAFDLLAEHDLVFGPASDGGYYLVGMRRLIREVFEDVPWSAKETLKKSLDKAEQYEYSVALTEMLSDVDTMEDVRRSGFLQDDQ